MIEKLDKELLFFINSNHTPFLDEIMWQISHQIVWVPLYIFFLIYAYKKLPFRVFLIFIFGVGLCFLLADQISVNGFKNVFMRYRPTHNLEIKEQLHTYVQSDGTPYLGGQYGFVSSHAANFFALSMYLFLWFKRYSSKWKLLFIWALIIVYSRVYLGVHYPTDIVGGSILGLLIGYAVYKLIHLLSLKLKYAN